MSTQISRREFLRFSGLAAVGIIAAACTPQAAPGSDPKAPTTAGQPPDKAPAGKATLRYLTINAAEVKQGYDDLLLDFSKEFSNIEIIQETMSGAGAGPYIDKLQTDIAAGDAPDFFFNWGGELAGVVIDGGKAFKLDDAYSKYGWEKIFYPWTTELCRRNGALWGAPINGAGMGFGYRKDIYEKVGIGEAKTYAELEEGNDKLKAQGIYAMSLGGKFGWHPMRLLDYLIETVAGPELHDKLALRTTSWDCPEVVEAYTLFRKWQEKGWLVPDFLGVAPNDARIPMYQGKAAAYFDGSGCEQTYAQDEQDIKKFGYYLPPTDHTPLRGCGYVHQHMIWTGSKYIEQALTFIDWFSQAKQQKTYMDKKVFTRTATIGVDPDPAVWPLTARIIKDMGQMKDVYLPKDQSFDPELINVFFQIQSDVVLGSTKPAEAAKQMQAGIEDWRKKTGKQ